MKKDVVLDEIFMKRIIESNVFSREEIVKIEKDCLLYGKCYSLGILDRNSFNDRNVS